MERRGVIDAERTQLLRALHDMTMKDGNKNARDIQSLSVKLAAVEAERSQSDRDCADARDQLSEQTSKYKALKHKFDALSNGLPRWPVCLVARLRTGRRRSWDHAAQLG